MNADPWFFNFVHSVRIPLKSNVCFGILSAQAKGPFVTLEQNGLLLSLQVPYTSIFRARGTLLWITELNLTVPKARPEADTFDFIGSGPGPVRDFGTERALAEPLGPNTGLSLIHI